MKKLLFSTLVVCFCITGYAQKKSTKEGLNAAGDIQAQYDYLWESSGKYQANKVIKMSILNQFNSNVQDSLKAIYQQVASSRSQSNSQAMSIANLEYQRDSVQELQIETEKKVNAFDFMGMETSKASFRALFFIISGALLILTLLSFFRMRSKSGQASEDKSRYNSLELEFEDFKKRSREKEQILARQLQDEINKNL